MSKIIRNLFPFRKEHAFKFNYREGDEFAIDSLMSLVSTDNEYIAYTATEDLKILGIGGCFKLWPGVAEFFMCVADGVLESPYSPSTRWIHKVAKEKINEVMQNNDLHRIQAVCDLRFPGRDRWLENLGFIFEGFMSAYTPDKATCARYAIVRY